MTTFIDIIKKSLIGEEILVHIYDVYHVPTKKRVQHHYVHNNVNNFYKNNSAWEDIRETAIYCEVVDVGGHYQPYEGNEVGLTVRLSDGDNIYISLEVDGEINTKLL